MLELCERKTNDDHCQRSKNYQQAKFLQVGDNCDCLNASHRGKNCRLKKEFDLVRCGWPMRCDGKNKQSPSNY